MKISEAAIAVLRRTENEAVMCGDSMLLHMIADEMGWEHHAWKTEKRVLDALSRNPGELEPGYVLLWNNRRARIFRLRSDE